MNLSERNERPLVDWNDALLKEAKAVDVAQCVATNAKPKPQIRWSFESKCN